MTLLASLIMSLLFRLMLAVPDEPRHTYPEFDYKVARAHEIGPHRRMVRLELVRPGFNQLRLTLTVSATGEVEDVRIGADAESARFWPEVEQEVRGWRFTPFEKDGKPVRAEVEEYLDFVPPEQVSKKHVEAPAIRTESKIEIRLERSACFGVCPAYSVTVSTEGIVFDGSRFVVARGRHTGQVRPEKVRELARRFVAADFYSLDKVYAAPVTDVPTYVLSIAIDGQKKEVQDYMGKRAGMPPVVTQLEEAVDELAGTARWIKGGDGLVEALKAERYNFRSFDGQVMLKEALTRGDAGTAGELLQAGVPLRPFAAPKPRDQHD